MAITLRVDGSDIEVPTGATVLDAVNRLGVPLPQLCKDPDRAPLGACSTCRVHVEGQLGFPAACHLPTRADSFPRPGMATSTSPKLRRGVILRPGFAGSR